MSVASHPAGPREMKCHPESAPARLVVLISGSGSNLQAIIDASTSSRLPARVVAVISNRKDAYGLVRAQDAGIPTVYHSFKPYVEDGRGRTRYDADLAKLTASYRPDWVVLAGWMHLLSMAFLSHFPGRVINLHPALPGQFPGTDGIRRAFEAFKAGRISHTGVMIHLVPDEGLDDGPVILSERVPICADDTLQTIERRIHGVEHRLIVQALNMLITRKRPPVAPTEN